MTSSEFFNAFQSYQVAHDQRRQLYKTTWFDVDNDKGDEKSFYTEAPAEADMLHYLVENEETFEMEKEYGHIYFSVESYF